MKLPAAFVFAVVLVLVLFCSIYKIDEITKSHRHVDKVFLYLQWFDQAQFAGFYAAVGKHYYDDADLDVQIIARPRDLKTFYANAADKDRSTMPNLSGLEAEWNVPAIVAASSSSEKPAAFGVWTGDQVLSQYDHDHLDIRAIGAVFNRSLACFMVRDDSPIYSPKDFGGKRIGVFRGYDTEIIYKWLISQYPPSTPPAPVPLNPSDDGLGMLARKDIAVLSAYAINEPLEASTLHGSLKFRTIYPDYYNVNYYSDTLIANRTALVKDPDLARRFIEASERGWRWAFDHPRDAVQFVVDGDKLLKGKEAQQVSMLERASFYVRTSNPMFKMDTESWKFMSRVLKEQGRINRDNGCGDLCDFDIAREAHEKRHIFSRE